MIKKLWLKYLNNITQFKKSRGNKGLVVAIFVSYFFANSISSLLFHNLIIRQCYYMIIVMLIFNKILIEFK